MDLGFQMQAGKRNNQFIKSLLRLLFLTKKIIPPTLFGGVGG